MRKRAVAVPLGAVAVLVLAAAAISAATSGRAEPPTLPADEATTRPLQPTGSPPIAGCPSIPPSATFPTTAQGVVPVQVPCFCPSQPLADLPTPLDEAAAVAAAIEFLGWNPTTVEPRAVYRVGATENADGAVIRFSLRQFCEPEVAERTLGVELWDPTVGQAGYYAAVVVGRFPSGWSVWGSYRGGPVAATR